MFVRMFQFEKITLMQLTVLFKKVSESLTTELQFPVPGSGFDIGKLPQIVNF